MRHVLVVDDDLEFADAVRELLEEAGYAVSLAHDRAALALRTADGPTPHVVLLDVRLDGPGWTERDGIDLMPLLLSTWPTARVIVVSGALTAPVVRRAFDAGAVDVLVKRDHEVLTEMLHHMIRRASEQAERDRLVLPEARERELRDAWDRARTASDPHIKGRALEDTVRHLLASVPGLTGFQRVQSDSEEFDLVVENNSAVPFLRDQGPVWLVECKNWSTKAGVASVRPLVAKMGHRYGRCKLGLLVSMNGFAGTVAHERADAATSALVVLVDGDDVDRAIATDDREAWLRAKILEATTR